MRIVARPRHLIHQDLTRISRVRPAPENPCASRNSLQRRRRGALEVTVIERVRDGPSKKGSQVNYHSVNPDVAVRRNQWWRLGSVNRLVEGPRALPGALRFGVSNPYISGAGSVSNVSGRAMGPTAAHAETLDGDVFSR
ncbi:hypothetical protein VIGAN_01152100 [Vigna angularis var. angularis]|uniref:Uncharacterized protein n=1 Tax=Vigna angularis var. angularis TaxID=157739 RepID=A0A0S3R091_PHAAN|nr:hypothetical protein VIGAN_01152100 [Vigna angularis var. angularis]